jgi:hypothetical protein
MVDQTADIGGVRQPISEERKSCIAMFCQKSCF